MALKKKVYAVRKGWKTGIFYSWKECQEAVNGFSGAEFKGFASEEEARAFLEGESLFLREDQTVKSTLAGTDVHPEHKDGPDREDVIAYVDGSYDKDKGRYGYGCLLLLPDGEEKLQGSGTRQELCQMRNVSGEMLGAMHAVKWAAEHQFGSMQLRYDYEGIEKWVSGVWKAKNPYTQKYAAFMREAAGRIALSFYKVRAHAGEELNEEVDRLAKEAVSREIPTKEDLL